MRVYNKVAQSSWHEMFCISREDEGVKRQGQSKKGPSKTGPIPLPSPSHSQEANTSREKTNTLQTTIPSSQPNHLTELTLRPKRACLRSLPHQINLGKARGSRLPLKSQTAFVSQHPESVCLGLEGRTAALAAQVMFKVPPSQVAILTVGLFFSRFFSRTNLNDGTAVGVSRTRQFFDSISRVANFSRFRLTG